GRLPRRAPTPRVAPLPCRQPRTERGRGEGELERFTPGRARPAGTRPSGTGTRPVGRTVGVLGGHDRVVLGLAFGADGRSLATLGHDGDVRFGDVATSRERVHLCVHAGMVYGAHFAPGGRSSPGTWTPWRRRGRDSDGLG